MPEEKVLSLLNVKPLTRPIDAILAAGLIVDAAKILIDLEDLGKTRLLALPGRSGELVMPLD